MLKRIKIEQKHLSALNTLIASLKNLGFLNRNDVEFAFKNFPRHEFIPTSEQNQAYVNRPLEIMKNQTISQPGVVSRMTEWLDVKDGQCILEVGTGSGWQTAILSLLVGTGTVYSIEIHSELFEFAKKNLEKFKIYNVNLILGDGGEGYLQASPYDRIIINAACNEVPLTLFEQLKENGFLVAPMGPSSQSLVLLKKTATGIIEIKNQSNYVFVPLLGKFGKKRIS